MRKLLIALAVIAWATPTYALAPKSCLLRHELAHVGGWPSDHPDAIKLKACGDLAMPRKGRYPVKVQPVIHYIPARDMPYVCGPFTQACTYTFTNPPWVYIPQEAQ